jgi:Arc/MetJ family transcription regulator
MRRLHMSISSAVLATLLTAACGSDGSSNSASPDSSTSSSSSSTSPSSPSTSAVRGPGGPGGGGAGGGGQTFTAVNLNTNGASPGGSNTADVVRASNAFLTMLDTTKKAAVNLAFTDNVSRQTWSNFPTTNVARKGVALKDLSADQRAAVLNIMRVALSGSGYQQVLDSQKSDDWLKANSTGGNSGFGSDLYYIAIYGTPSETQPFMVQFGGHHVARQLTYNGDRVSQTPQFVGSEPVKFDLDGKTYEPVKAESTALFAMLGGLNSDQLAKAKVTSGTFTDLVMGPGKDTGVFPTAEGVLVSDLNDSQRRLVVDAIRAYVGDLADSAATRLQSKYEGELSQTRVAWSNNTGPDQENSYIRIDGPSIWIEFINTRSQSTPNIHYHSVYRDKANDYGSSKPT